MKAYYAHSPKKDIPAQQYAAHVEGVLERVKKYAFDASQYSTRDGDLLQSVVKTAAFFHDLGKLEFNNQEVLSGEKSAKKLPINHVDAGTARVYNDNRLPVLSALLIHGHHAGLADFIEEGEKEDDAFRDPEIMAETDRILPQLDKIHENHIKGNSMPSTEIIHQSDLSVFLRIALSCLVDADHTDTAVHYRKQPACEPVVPLRASERLRKLDVYVSELKKDDSERTLLRSKMYIACRDANVSSNISSCDSPVGSGKTTAVMAHLLAQADKRGLRRIFVVLPFTSIITQSVNTYRKALTLPGENPNEVVAELHHRADFESEDVRHLSALWRAPIIVTTAVAFFETLASRSTSTLRRLHELPGSAVFVDESHAALPANLLPLAWRWMNIYASNWNCYWLLASGSLCRFWTIEEIASYGSMINVAEIVDDGLRNALSKYERHRVSYCHDLRPKSIQELADWVVSSNGPRLVILNIVQNAAVLADHLREHFGSESVEHLSTALTTKDREATLRRIKKRLKNTDDDDWALIATSCVEAGIDISFRTGFREVASVVSVLQAAGRINREGLHGDSQIYSFFLAREQLTNTNRGLRDSSEVLKGYLAKRKTICPELSTKSIADEITLFGMQSKGKELLPNECAQRFPLVEREFRVIDTNARICVIDKALVDRIRYGTVNWRELQENSVQIEKHKLDEIHAPILFDEIYYWNLDYDCFLGYMAGLLSIKKLEANGMIL